MSDETSPPSPHMVSMAHTNYRKAIDWMACVIAVKRNEMSENEAMRWLNMDEVEQAESELGPNDECFEVGEERLREVWNEERGDLDG